LLNSDLIAGLSACVPSDSIIADLEALRPYECDGLTAYRQLPVAVVLPKNVEEIRAVMQFCLQSDVPIVPRGAGTSLSGGAQPEKDGIVLSLARLNQILEVDVENRLARVQPGVRNLAVSQRVAEFGLYYAPDPSSQIACTIGGNVAENAGGIHCLKYGLTVHNVLSIDVVLATGEDITLTVDAPGYDLLALMHGSEGLLGIVTEITVRLLAEPPSARTVLAAFDNVSLASDAVAGLISSGVIPAGLEMMDKLAIDATNQFADCGYPNDASAILICELDGNHEEVLQQVKLVTQMFTKNGATDLHIAESEDERLKIWSGRKNAFPAVGRLSPDYYCIDGTIPRKNLGDVLKQIYRLSEEYGLAVANVFHAGDGNLHPLILYDASNVDEFHRTEVLGGQILELCIDAGGTITGEHGVGVEKLDQMCIQFSEAEIAQFRLLKQAFDPKEILNPGKAIPTLTRCSELNGLHVHAGAIPFPDIERF